MNVADLLVELTEKGVQFSVDGDQLRLRAPKGVLTSDVRALLTDHKPEIVAFLRGRDARLEPHAISVVSRDGPLPLSFAQARLWFFAQMYPESAVYNLPNAFRLEGPLDVEALRQSVERIVRRHEILRTTFVQSDGEPMQRISPHMSVALPLIDLRGVPEATRDAEAHRLAREEAEERFDLSRGPLVRVKLLQTADEQHLFLLTLHHIVSDGWSSIVLLRELKAHYEELTTGRPAQLPELPVQFADFASWERRWFQGEVLADQLDYWRTKLTNAVPVLELPADHPRPPIKTYEGDCHSFRLGEDVVTGLKALGQEEGVTLFMTLVAALKVLLFRYTGQRDVIVGSPIAHRNWGEVVDLVGCFINALPLRTTLDGDDSFRALLGRVRETCAGAFAHQDLPFEKLVEELQVERDMSVSPIFQVMMILHVQDRRKITELGPVALSPVELHSRTAKYDLTLELIETNEGITGWVEYSTDLFDAARMERLVGHFVTLLEAVVADPEDAIGTIPLLTGGERHTLLVEWNQTEAPYRDVCIHQLVESQAASTPDAVAVEYGERHLTYEELDRRATLLARYLRSVGIGRGSLVGVFMERSPEMVVALLGVLKAGGAYVPFDPALPRERCAFMAEDSGVAVFLTQESLIEALPSRGTRVICLDSGWPEIAETRADAESGAPTSDDLAYVIYTSGSTGRPKGVEVRHQGVVNFLNSMALEPGISERDMLLSVTTLSFDIAVLELFLPLVVGARVRIVSREVAADGVRLSEALATSKATVMQATPATWRMLLTAGWEGSPGLRLLCGGEALPRDLADELIAQADHVWNLYGPTETTIWSAVHRVAEGTTSVPIGRPIANTQLYVLDTYLNPVPLGVPGELHIGGDGVARGYLGRPELTAERFIPNPFDAEASRIYKTGDLVRYLPDGSLEFLGRLDHQVKVRGFRIELGEIEAALGEQRGVRQVVVVAREDRPGDKRLVAYVVPEQGHAPDQGALRSSLQTGLPEYMVPAAFVLLDALPLTPNGKVDRKALPAPQRTAHAATKAFVAPRDALERQLTGMWQDLLGVSLVGREDDFFELGGHSLLVARLFAVIEKEMGVRLPLATLFQNPTVAHLSRCLAKEGAAIQTDSAPELRVPPEGQGSGEEPLTAASPGSEGSGADLRSRLKQSAMVRRAHGLYRRQKKNIADKLLSYTPEDLEDALRSLGIASGDTVMMHSAFRTFSGFTGTPDDVIDCVVRVIGAQGNLVMVSMPYSGATSDYLESGVPFDVRQTMSAMGVITEVFRHQSKVLRSLNPAHPVLASGPAAAWLVAGHESTLYSCGKGSPFEKLLRLGAKALFYDVRVETMTFFHYLEDLLQDTLPAPLYEDGPVPSTVIDADGNERCVQTHVFSRAARRHRKNSGFQQALAESDSIRRVRIGNSTLSVLQLATAVECAERMAESGTPLWTIQP